MHARFGSKVTSRIRCGLWGISIRLEAGSLRAARELFPGTVAGGQSAITGPRPETATGRRRSATLCPLFYVAFADGE